MVRIQYKTPNSGEGDFKDKSSCVVLQLRPDDFWTERSWSLQSRYKGSIPFLSTNVCLYA